MQSGLGTGYELHDELGPPLGVRSALMQHQRKLGLRYGTGEAEREGIIMVGRDIGTSVLPEAPLKGHISTPALDRHGQLLGVVQVVIDSVTLSAYRITFALTLRAARPMVCTVSFASTISVFQRRASA